MASWKGLYSNVDVLEHGLEEPRAHAQRSQPAGTKENLEEEGVYETADPAAGLEGKQTERVPASGSSARKPACTRKVVIIAAATLLAASVSLNVLLLALGTAHCKGPPGPPLSRQSPTSSITDSKKAATLGQVYSENSQPDETGFSSFLLYNEDHKICVTVQEPKYLTGASCDPQVRTQHFQWLSRGLLRHVASQLCVAASEAKSRTALRLKPCSAQSPLQHWECREDNLLALEGKDLYFNYGNQAHHLVMLYSGKGLWSRWLVYQTHNSICGTCPPFVRDWTSFQGSYYFLSHSPGTWDVANQSCTSMGSHLVMISSAKEKVLEGDWTWVDGTHIGPDNGYWDQNEPNGGKAENCALMRNSLWYDYPCKESYRWICERKH